jgi:hypothetical protein
MRLTLTNDDGGLRATWSIPDTLTDAEIEQVIADGLWREYRLDRCDECGRFTPHAGIAEQHDQQGPTALCPTCAAVTKPPVAEND